MDDTWRLVVGSLAIGFAVGVLFTPLLGVLTGLALIVGLIIKQSTVGKGAQDEYVCPACAQPVLATARFCQACGTAYSTPENHRTRTKRRR